MINIFKSKLIHFIENKERGFHGSSGLTFMEVIIMIAIIAVIMATGMKQIKMYSFVKSSRTPF